MIFDSFVLGDKWSVLCFDRGISGQMVTIGDEQSTTTAENVYKRYNYDEISGGLQPFPQHGKATEVLSYSDLYSQYLVLDPARATLLQSFAVSPSRLATRSGPLSSEHQFSIMRNYIFLDTILKEMGFKAKASKKDMWSKFLEVHIVDEGIREQYLSVILAAAEIRNRVAHEPTREIPKLDVYFSHRESYDALRASEEHFGDYHALSALAVAVDHVTRSAIMQYAFGISRFEPLRSVLFRSFGNQGGCP